MSQPAGTDPYVPGHGDASYSVKRYVLHIGYKVIGNRLNGEAALTCEALTDLTSLSLDLHTLRPDKVTISRAIR